MDARRLLLVLATIACFIRWNAADIYQIRGTRALSEGRYPDAERLLTIGLSYDPGSIDLQRLQTDLRNSLEREARRRTMPKKPRVHESTETRTPNRPRPPQHSSDESPPWIAVQPPRSIGSLPRNRRSDAPDPSNPRFQASLTMVTATAVDTEHVAPASTTPPVADRSPATEALVAPSARSSSPTSPTVPPVTAAATDTIPSDTPRFDLFGR